MSYFPSNDPNSLYNELNRGFSHAQKRRRRLRSIFNLLGLTFAICALAFILGLIRGPENLPPRGQQDQAVIINDKIIVISPPGDEGPDGSFKEQW